MPSRVETTALLLLLMCLPPPAFAGQARSPVTPPRDGSAVAATSAISGRAVAAETAAPLRRARLILSGGGLNEARTINTDSRGRYQFRDLPAGRYSLSASRNGYLKVSYGQKRPDGLARTIDLAQSQVLDRIDFVLPRMAILSGRIVDEAGEPLETCTVTAYRKRYSADGAQLVASGFAVSDASGFFRILSLYPGEYWLQATSHESWTADEDGRSDTHSYAPTFYPGVPLVSSARSLRVKAGDDVPNLEFALLGGRAVSVSGTAMNARGMVLGNHPLYLMQQTLATANGVKSGMNNILARATTDANGAFRFANVATGAYKLQTMVTATQDAAAEAASVEIAIADADIANISLMTSSGGQAKGRVETDSGAAPPFSPSKVHVVARPAVDQAVPIKIDGDNGAVGDDWSFTVRGLFDKVLLRPTNVPAGWALKSVYVSDREVTDVPLDAIDLGEQVRVLTDKIAGLSGSVTNQRGQPVDDYMVIVFPVDDRLWSGNSRFVRAARAGLNGQYAINSLPSTDYYVAAVEDVEPDQWLDPGFLQQLSGSARRVSIREGEKVVQELKLLSSP